MKLAKYLKLEQAGIILNALAGILFGINYFIYDDVISRINNTAVFLLTSLKEEISSVEQNWGYLIVFCMLILFLLTLPLIKIYKKSRLADFVLETIFPISFIVFAVSMFSVLVIYISTYFITLTPKGFLGLVTLICFIIGNALQLIYASIPDIDPHDASDYNDYGLNLYVQGKFHEALQAYDKAIELNKQYSEAWSNKGIAFHSLGKKNENTNTAMSLYQCAIEAYDKAIELNPRNAKAWCNKGIAFYSLCKRSEEAQAVYYFFLGDEEVQTGPVIYEKAIEAYDEAIEMNPQCAEAWYNRGIALDHLGFTKDAELAFAKARDLYNVNSDTQNL